MTDKPGPHLQSTLEVRALLEWQDNDSTYSAHFGGEEKGLPPSTEAAPRPAIEPPLQALVQSA